MNAERAKKLYESLDEVADAIGSVDEGRLLHRFRQTLRAARDTSGDGRAAIDRWILFRHPRDLVWHSGWPRHMTILVEVSRNLPPDTVDVDELREIMRLARTAEAWPTIDTWLKTFV